MLGTAAADPPAAQWGSRPRPWHLAGAGWAIAYVACWATGQRFLTGYVREGWQVLPWNVLRAHPVRSVWYLHVQPPLWNLVLGAVGRWSPLPLGVSLQLVMAAIGVGLAAVVCELLQRLGLRPGPAVVVALLATANSEVLKLAFIPQYELPVALGLALIVWALAGDAPAQRVLWWVVGAATAVALTRSVFHPVWLVLLVASVVVLHRRQLEPRRVIACAAVAVMLVGGWMAKNAALFGTATTSSWSGMNLLRSIQPMVPTADLLRLRDSGVISGVAVTGTFLPFAQYAADLPPCHRAHTDPAVSLAEKPGVAVYGLPVANMNDECLLAAYDRAGSDALALIRHRPALWIRGRWVGARVWFTSSEGSAPNSSPLMRWIAHASALWRLSVPNSISMRGWGAPFAGDDAIRARLHLADVALTVATLAGAIGSLRRRAGCRDRRRAGAIVIAGGIVLWTFIVGIIGELGEQSRFRMMVDPLVTAIGVLVVLRLLARRWYGARQCFEASS